MNFELTSDYKPTGDQPEAIEALVSALEEGVEHNTLMGITGSGKTFTVANVVAQIGAPTLVLCHNKTLAAQLYSEFKNFFPSNAVEYFVSYYDYYQPEAYLPNSDTYIEKDLAINDEIEKMRLSTTSTLLSGRRDVIVVSSVSCLYGIGNPDDFRQTSIEIKVGDEIDLRLFLYRLVEALYTRTELALESSMFRVNGDSVDIMSAFGDNCYRIRFDDDAIGSIDLIDRVSKGRISSLERVVIYPANLFVTTKERINSAISQIYLDMGAEVAEFESNGRMVEAQRLKQRVEYDLEMIKELGYCSGIENYSRYFDGRDKGSRPFCLLDYFPSDFITVVDESHVTLPQVHAMFGGDKARKENLVSYGFRLEAAKDNRPLTFAEFEQLIGRRIYVSATPGKYEYEMSEGIIVEQLIRPTGLVDPALEVRSSENQIDDLIAAIEAQVRAGNRVLVTTITKRMAEELSRYLDRVECRNRYIHSEIDTLERVEILDGLREGLFDVLIGVNLLREGLDLPEVGLVAILDAGKDGFLRNATSLTQIAGRAARHVEGEVILYASSCSKSMIATINDSNRRRLKQIAYNIEHQQLPRSAKKSGDGANKLRLSSNSDDIPVVYPLGEEHYAQVAEPQTASYTAEKPKIINYDELIAQEREAMTTAAKALDFKAAATHRDRMYQLIKARDNQDSDDFDFNN